MKLLIGVGFLALACSKGGEGARLADAENEPPPPAAAPECVDEHEQPVQCETDADCCKGFVCGKDPEQSHRVKFCLYAG